MRLSLESLSMSQLISSTDFDLDDSRINRRMFFKDYYFQNKDVILTNANLDIFKIKGKNRIIGADDARKQIAYFVKFKSSFSVLIGKYIQQIELWADRSVPSTANVSRRVFFEHLIRVHGTMLADTYQTRAGAAFWSARCLDAIQMGFNVYVVDFHNKSISAVTYDNMDEMFVYATGKTRAHMGIRLCISNKKLI